MIEIRNPYTQKIVSNAPETDLGSIPGIFLRAHDTSYTIDGKKRAAILSRAADLIRAKKESCAKTITDESGLCLKDSLHEIDRVISAARYAALVAAHIEEDTTAEYILDAAPGPKLHVITEPLDLAVGITPFNHPMNQVAHKVFPAIAAGTPIILKPSEKTPLSAFLLKNILEEAGLPEHSLTIVINRDIETTVRTLVTSPHIDLVSFTGSYDVGMNIARIMKNSNNALKKFIPELGGLSPFIIAADADLEKAAEIAVQGCFGNSGQRCTAIRRIIVMESIADEFIRHFVARTEKIRYGNPYDQATDMGTVINEDAAILIQLRVEKAIRDGAKLLLGNKREGAFFSPTILDRVSQNSELVTCETFGPVAPIIRAENLDRALAIAKNTDYALAGAIATSRRETAERVAKELCVGQFSWNGIPGYRTEAAPFGGFKRSGNGEKEGMVLATKALRRIRTFYEH